MKIVACDDSKEDLAEIKRLLEKYREKNADIEFEVMGFLSSDALYGMIKQEELGDIYILDIIMADKTGIDIGSMLRMVSEKSVIIYITSSEDYAMEAYSVRAVRYLIKPIREELFFEALDYAVSDILNVKKDAFYQVKTKEGLMSIPYSRIECIENYARTLHICMTDGNSIQSIFIRKSFEEEVRPLAEDKRFVHVHKSFLVNMDHIYKLAQNTIIMENGQNIPISRTRAAEVKKAYLMYVSAKYS